MLRLFFLIRSLDRGGAERQLIELVRQLSRADFQVTVCTFYANGALRPELERVSGVRLVSLDKGGRFDVVGLLRRLVPLVIRERPDVIHGYMGIANELALLAARVTGARCVWGLRASNMDLSRYGRLSTFAFRFGSLLSRFPDAIIVNSSAGLEHHRARGYAAARMHVVPNGIDCDRFAPDSLARARVRAEWGIADHEPLIGLVARLDPMKDHDTFLRAAALLAARRSSLRFVCVGGGPAAENARLGALASELGLEGRILWTGARSDTAAVHNAIDVPVLASAFGEGFPNVVAEAMATGKCCVVTDVGDSAAVVGDTGSVVPPRHPSALAAAIDAVLDLEPEAMARRGLEARARVASTFSTERLAQATAAILRGVASVARGVQPDDAGPRCF